MEGQFQDTTKTKIQNAIRKLKELTPNQRLIENKKCFDALAELKGSSKGEPRLEKEISEY